MQCDPDVSKGCIIFTLKIQAVQKEECLTLKDEDNVTFRNVEDHSLKHKVSHSRR